MRRMRPLLATTLLTFGAGAFAAGPFDQPSTLLLQAPRFDRIHDTDYLPALEAGMVARYALVLEDQIVVGRPADREHTAAEGDSPTTAVGPLVELVVPPWLDAVTVTRSVCPTSVDAGV